MIFEKKRGFLQSGKPPFSRRAIANLLFTDRARRSFATTSNFYSFSFLKIKKACIL